MQVLKDEYDVTLFVRLALAVVTMLGTSYPSISSVSLLRPSQVLNGGIPSDCSASMNFDRLFRLSGMIGWTLNASDLCEMVYSKLELHVTAR